MINEKDGFINAAGMQSPGLTASPAIAQELVKYFAKTLKLEEKAKWEYKPLVKKFSRCSTEEKFELAKNDANHTKIICSCEMVTEADV